MEWHNNVFEPHKHNLCWKNNSCVGNTFSITIRLSQVCSWFFKYNRIYWGAVENIFVGRPVWSSSFFLNYVEISLNSTPLIDTWYKQLYEMKFFLLKFCGCSTTSGFFNNANLADCYILKYHNFQEQYVHCSPKFE